jgi:hypothetical protein
MSVLERQIEKKRQKFAPVAGGGVSSTSGSTQYILPSDDIRRIPGQNFLVLSYACPDGVTRVRSPKGMVMKFSGTFPTLAAADEHANAIRNEDPRFDVFVVDLYKWGQVPMPDEEKPFVTRRYTEEMLTRIVAGLQHSMVQGKKEMDERKARDRAKAEAAMRRAKGDSEYKMPEKSKLFMRYEADVRKEREDEEKKARDENRCKKILYDEETVLSTLIEFCVDNLGKTIDAGTATAYLKYLVEKSIEREAQRRKVHDREIGKEDEHPDVLDEKLEAREKYEAEKKANEERGCEPKNEQHQ